MPVVEFKSDNKVQDASSFPRLKLENGDRARILCIEKNPNMEYIHRLEKPRITNGEPEYEWKEAKDGSKTKALVKDFIGTPICMGDAGILADKGVDPANCPICALSVAGDMVAGPTRRFAMNIVRYATKPGGFEPQDPFSVSVIAWAFGDTMFNRLVDFAEEWGSLQKHDLLLGPCTNKQYQKFEVSIAATAAWQESDARKKLVVDTYNASRTEDLASLCGRKAKRDFVEQDLENIQHAWRFVNSGGTGAGESGADLSGDLTAGLDGLSGLLDSPANVPEVATETLPPADPEASFRDIVSETETPAAAVPPVNQGLLDDLLTEPVPTAAPEAAVAPPAAPVAEAPAAAPAEAEKPKGEVVSDFDSLLAGLD